MLLDLLRQSLSNEVPDEENECDHEWERIEGDRVPISSFNFDEENGQITFDTMLEVEDVVCSKCDAKKPDSKRGDLSYFVRPRYTGKRMRHSIDVNESWVVEE